MQEPAASGACAAASDGALAPTSTRQAIDRVIDAFMQAAAAVGCTQREPAIAASGGFDPSVRFIGSHISVFLPRMLEARVPPGGLAMWQDCIRTRALAPMRATGRLDSAWGSCFVSLGALLPDADEQAACALLDRCFRTLHVDLVEVSFLGSDRRLAAMARREFPDARLREDSEPRPYRHKVGVASVRGMNINLAVGRQGQRPDPVANVIVYEDDGRPCGIEVALGTSTVVKVLDGLDHVMETFPLPALPALDLPAAVVRCWKDAAVTSLHLLREGLAPAGQHNRSRLLRAYIDLLRRSPVTRALGPRTTRVLLQRYLADFYTTPYARPAARPEAEQLDLLLGDG